MAKHTPPIGDLDLSGGRPGSGENIESGGAGFSGSGFASTRRLGGMGSTSDGVGSRGGGGGSVDGDPLGGDDADDAATLGDLVSDVPDDADDFGDNDFDGDPDPDGDTDAIAEGSIEAPAPRTPAEDIERATDNPGSTESMRGATGGLAGSSR